MGEYDKIANFIAKDRGMAIFRRFAALNAKNLLYYQAELTNLEVQLRDIVQADKDMAMPETEYYPCSVHHLKKSLSEHVELKSGQWEKFMEIRELLEKYNNALLQQRQLMCFKSPEDSDLKVLQDWLDRPESSGKAFKRVSEMNQWSEENDEDLVVLRGRHEGEDPLTRWIYNYFVPWFHKIWGHRSKKRQDPERGVSKYSDRTIKRFTHTFSTLISAVLPASAMIVLYFLSSTVVRLLVIFCYNVAFSFALGLLVKARPVEIFAAATAFAAVQVTMITNAPEQS